MFPWGCLMVSLQTSASFSYTLSNQPVFYATHNQSYPSASEERAARWVGFGEYVGDALTHKLLDDDTKKILYRSAVRELDLAMCSPSSNGSKMRSLWTNQMKS